MSRTIELGRAVLSSPMSKLELWLTTSITVSPAQYSIDLHQLSEQDLIALLSSGNVWTGRGNGMQLAFNITTQRAPLSSSLTRQLANCIVAAPAWEHLKLQPSLSLDHVLSPGKFRLKLDLSRQDEGYAGKKAPRTCSGISIEHCVPPKGVPAFELQAIEYLLHVTETRGQLPMSPSRRTKVARNGPSMPLQDSPFPGNGGSEEAAVMFVKDLNVEIAERQLDNGSEMLFAKAFDDGARSPYAPGMPRVRPSSQPSLTRKRSRYTLEGAQPEVSLLHHEKQRSSALGPNTSMTKVHCMADSQRLSIVIDAAVRISVFGNLRGSLGNVKIKASTFVESLAGVVPFLWRPGYRAAMAATTGVNPALSLSLARVSLRAMSGTLRAKADTGSSPLPQGSAPPVEVNVETDLDVSDVSLQLAARFWIKGQKALLSKSVHTWAHDFCTLGFEPGDDANVDEVLEEHSGQSTCATDSFGSRSMTRSTSNVPSSGLIRGYIHEPVPNVSMSATECDVDLLFDFANSRRVPRMPDPIGQARSIQ